MSSVNDQCSRFTESLATWSLVIDVNGKRMPRLLALEWDAKEARVVIAPHARRRRRRRAGAGDPAAAARRSGARRRRISARRLGQGAGRARRVARRNAGRGRPVEHRAASSSRRRPPRPKSCPTWCGFRRCGSSRRWATIGRSTSCRSSPNADGGSNVLAAAISPDLVAADPPDLRSGQPASVAAGAAAVCRGVAAARPSSATASAG